MDILLPECVDGKALDSSPILEIAHISLDKSESSEGANDCVYTDSPTITSKGNSFQLTNCTLYTIVHVVVVDFQQLVLVCRTYNNFDF